MGFGSTKKKRVLSNEILLSHEILCPFYPKITVIAVSGVITITILLVHWEMVSELSNPWYLKASICNLVHDKTLNISGCEWWQNGSEWGEMGEWVCVCKSNMLSVTPVTSPYFELIYLKINCLINFETRARQPSEIEKKARSLCAYVCGCAYAHFIEVACRTLNFCLNYANIWSHQNAFYERAKIHSQHRASTT